MTQVEQHKATEIGKELSDRLQKSWTVSLSKTEKLKHLEQLAIGD